MKRLIFLLIAALAVQSPAAAQEMGWSVVTPSMAGTDILGVAIHDSMQQQRARRGGGGGAGQRNNLTAAPPAAPADLSAIRYQPSKARRSANLAQFVQKARAVDRGNAEDLQRLFASGDFIDKIGGVLAPLGLRVDNLADAYAIWWISAWNATRGNNDSPSRTMAQAVSAQAARALSSAPDILRADDAAKQEFAEALLIQMALVDTAVDQNKNNPAQLRALGSAVAQGAEAMGLDLSIMQLTENGFVPADGADAGAAKTGNDPAPTQLGAARVTPAEKKDTLPYGLAAAAAGLGAGGWALLRRQRA